MKQSWLAQKVKFNNYGALCCPYCSSDWLHQNMVDAFFREEDAEKGLRARINNQSCVTSTEMEGNPSPRRDGLAISFFCEDCERNDIELVIWQHKGQTQMNWSNHE